VDLPVRMAASNLAFAYVENYEIAFRQERQCLLILSERQAPSQILNYGQLQETDSIDREPFDKSRFTTHFVCNLGDY
jgi:hypothetical protein